MAELKEDKQLGAFELVFYVVISVLILVLAVFGGGINVEQRLPSASEIYILPSWGADSYRLFVVLIGVPLVWAIALFLCLVSRRLEWLLRIGPEADASAARSLLAASGEDRD